LRHCLQRCSPFFPYTTLFRSILPPDKAGAERAIFGPIVDAVGLVDGKFKTPKLLPGDYVVNVDVYLPEPPSEVYRSGIQMPDYRDRKSTRLNSSHLGISYAVF